MIDLLQIKRLLRYSPILLFLAFFTALPASSASAAEEGGNAAVLCLPGVYLASPADCTVTGPADYQTDLARQGMRLPLQPLPAVAADPNLPYSSYQYARLKENVSVPLYNSLEDAMAKRGATQFIEAGKLRYVSYVEEANTNDTPKPDFFRLRSGVWISAGDVAQRENAVIRFQGLDFRSTPSNVFGWILPLQSFTETRRTPGYAAQDFTGHQLVEYTVVQVYATQEVDGSEWYLVSPDEWVEGRMVGRVLPNTTPPEGVTNGRWIEINLFEQTLAVYDNNNLVFATLIASGSEPFYTRPGLFPIYKKLETTPMRGSFEADRSDFYYLEDVPWTMYFDEARALHAAYWRTRFGFAQSHGCVNLSPGDANWLFHWAQEGDWVYVWDPSGKTPTDPAFYGAGGA